MKFSKEQLLKLILDKGLEITLVATVDVKKSEYPVFGITSFLTTAIDEKDLEDKLKIYNLDLIDKKYMLLTNEEISHIEKKGYLLN